MCSEICAVVFFMGGWWVELTQKHTVASKTPPQIEHLQTFELQSTLFGGTLTDAWTFNYQVPVVGEFLTGSWFLYMVKGKPLPETPANHLPPTAWGRGHIDRCELRAGVSHGHDPLRWWNRRDVPGIHDECPAAWQDGRTGAP